MSENHDLSKRFDELETRLVGLVTSHPFSTFQDPSSGSDEIDLRELWNIVWGGKWIIIGVTLLFAFASMALALSLPNIYKSEILLAPAEENSGGGLAGLAGQFGGLARLAGVGLGSGAGDKTALAIAVLQSREFISMFVRKHELLIPLMAADGWDSTTNKLLLNSNVYDEKSRSWLLKSRWYSKTEPAVEDVYERFMNILSVHQDKKTDFVTIEILFYSPQVAKQWADLIVAELNEEIRKRDVEEATKNIEYLSSQLKKTSIADMQNVFYELIEEQVKTLMFAEVRREYAFKVIDSAYLPEKKSGPQRLLFVVVGVVLGGFFGICAVFVRHLVFRNG